MPDRPQLVVSHPPFWHVASRIPERSLHAIAALRPAAVFGIHQYGIPALAVLSLSVSTAMIWELLFNRISGRPASVGDGNAAFIGLLFGMLLPATAPWWAVASGTFVAIIVGKLIFGGIGANPFNPAATAVAILMVSWKALFDFDGMLLDYDLGFRMVYPLAALKHFGPSAVADFGTLDLLMGGQVGALGTGFGLGLILGGLYLSARGFIRWEIPLSFAVGLAATAQVFALADPGRYAGALFHLFSGYSLIAIFFLSTEDASSPVHFTPMLIYGAGAGVMTMLIRNLGAYVDGAVFAVLVMNLLNPMLDQIRPKALGKVV